MNFIVLMFAHSPFQTLSLKTTSSRVKSGIQNPVVNSFPSTCARCTRASSRLLGGRPFLRSCRSSSISGAARSMNLWNSQCVSCVPRRGKLLAIYHTHFCTSSAISLSDKAPEASFRHSWKKATLSTAVRQSRVSVELVHGTNRLYTTKILHEGTYHKTVVSSMSLPLHGQVYPPAPPLGAVSASHGCSHGELRVCRASW